MKRFLPVALGILAASVLMLCATACNEDFDPTEKDDFIGTVWKANDEVATYTLKFKRDYVSLRYDVKAGGNYTIAGDYDYYPSTGTVMITYSELVESHDINPQFSLIIASGQLRDDYSKMDYVDSKSMTLIFTLD